MHNLVKMRTSGRHSGNTLAVVDLTFNHCWLGTSLLIINRRQATHRASVTT